MSQLTVWYHPSTVVMVDDNLRFLDNVTLELGLEKTSFRLFSRPQNALKFLTEDYQLPAAIAPTEEELRNGKLSTSINSIVQQIYNPDRFKLVSVIVVDFAMPGITGTHLAEAIQHLPYKVILLTGEAGQDQVEKLLKTRAIDRNIRKDGHDAIQQLAAAIYELQLEFFAERSAAIANLVPKRTAAFADPQCCEYYLANTNGALIGFDILGNLIFGDISETENIDHKAITSYSCYLDNHYKKDGKQ